MVIVRIWDLNGEVPLGLEKVELSVLQKAENLARERSAKVVHGLVRISLRDLDLARVEDADSKWLKDAEFESSLPKGYRLDPEQGLVQDREEVKEMGIG